MTLGDAFNRRNPGTEKASARQYTVQECRDKIAEIVAEDERLALRISRTNQQAPRGRFRCARTT